MSYPDQLSRRGFLTLAACSVAACGGGGSDYAGMPGTGGTGITSYGSISGFGSVIVNGVKFDDTNASVLIDSNYVTAADLRLGMVTSVQGVRGSSPAVGTANSIVVWSCAQGVVSKVSTDQIVVAGMTISLSTSTVLDGVMSAQQICVGLTVAVWGLQLTSDATSWLATRLVVSNSPRVVTTGLVKVAIGQKTINGLLLSGSRADALTDSELVRIDGDMLPNGNGLYVVNVVDFGKFTQPKNDESEIEGVITAIVSPQILKIGSISVNFVSATFSPSNFTLVAGTRVEVAGSWQNGILMARKISAEDEHSTDEFELEARITEFTSISNFVVRGQRCDASGVTKVGNGTLADILLGAKVHLKGNLSGNILKVSQISIDA